jgi:pseudouridine-5'-phosphate glycosidase
MKSFTDYTNVHPDVASALSASVPVLALESTLFSHGLPYQDSLYLFEQINEICVSRGVVPALFAVIDGSIHVGLRDEPLRRFLSNGETKKIGAGEIAVALEKKWLAATTVSATMRLAYRFGISVFTTGGIGGVHKNVDHTFDISQDLHEFTRSPIVVVSAGAKAILDIPKTLECLETYSIPVIGYKTNEFPAFYSRRSGSRSPIRCDSPGEIADLFRTHSLLGTSTAILVANPIPKDNEISSAVIEPIIESALALASEKGIEGKSLTPFLLDQIRVLTNGESVRANLSLVMNNVRLGAEIARILKI